MTKLSYPLLAIDTSSELAYVSLASSSGEFVTQVSSKIQSHSEELESLVFGCLESKALAIESVKSILIGSGPGSFTGLRVGFSFIKGLAFGLQLPVYKLPSIRAAAACCSGFRVVAIDARRDQFFTGIYIGDSNSPVVLVENKLFSKSELSLEIDKLLEENDFSSKDSSLLTNRVAELDSLLGRAMELPKLSEGLLELAKKQIILDSYSDKARLMQSWQNLEPDYVRAVAAKTIIERKQAGRSSLKS